MRRVPASVCPLLLALLVGCASSPIPVWQRSLEEFVENKGDGDLNVLRNAEGRPSKNEFGVIGAKKGGMVFISPRRTDANGVLLGLERICERSWYIFLVGTVEYRGSFVNFPLDDPQLTDIRLIALSGREGAFEWVVGEPDAAALSQYCRPHLEAWRRSHPSRSAATESPTIFPTPKDIFRLSVEPPVVTATDEYSGARWAIVITAQESGVRSQESGVRRQESGVRSQESEEPPP